MTNPGNDRDSFKPRPDPVNNPTGPTPPPVRVSPRLGLIIGGVVVAGLIVSQSIRVIPAGFVGVVFSSFTGPLMSPLPGVWAARLAPLGLKPPVPPAARIGTLEAAQELLTAAGFAELRLEVRSLPLLLTSAEERWVHIVQGLEGLPLRSLPLAEVARLRAEHLAELAPLFAGGPATFAVPLLLAAGRAPGG